MASSRNVGARCTVRFVIHVICYCIFVFCIVIFCIIIAIYQKCSYHLSCTIRPLSCIFHINWSSTSKYGGRIKCLGKGPDILGTNVYGTQKSAKLIYLDSVSLRKGSVIVYFRLMFTDFLSADPTNVAPGVPFESNDVIRTFLASGGTQNEVRNVTLGRFFSVSSDINIQPGDNVCLCKT